MKKSDPVPGQKFGLLTIVEDVGKIRWERHVLCKCECGGDKVANWYNVRNGNIKSCGCLQKNWWNQLRVLGKNRKSESAITVL
jgi:hypothetical protein